VLFSISLAGGKFYVFLLHRKAFPLLNSIRALNALPSSNYCQAQINNVSRSARITFSAILKNVGGSAFVRRRFRAQEAIMQTHKNGARSEMPNKALKLFASLTGTAYRGPLA
jgi:hypothetical protein